MQRLSLLTEAVMGLLAWGQLCTGGVGGCLDGDSCVPVGVFCPFHPGSKRAWVLPTRSIDRG